MDTPGTAIRTPLLHQVGRLTIMLGALAFAFVLTAAPYALGDENEPGRYWVCKYTGGPEGEPSHVISPHLEDPESFSDEHGSFVIGPADEHTEEEALAICLNSGDDNDTNDDDDNNNNNGDDNDDNDDENNENDNDDDGENENENGESGESEGTDTGDATDDVEEGVLDAALDQDGDDTDQGTGDDGVDEDVLAAELTELPRTGADDPGVLAGLAVLLLAAGTGLLRLGRRFEPTI